MTKTLRKKPFDNFKLRILQYLLGFVVLPLGIVTVLSTGLGAGAWDTTSYNLSAFIGSTLGTASGLINATVMGVVMLYRRKGRFIFMIIPIIGVATFLDFWDIVVFSNLDIGNYHVLIRLALFAIGTFIITFGLSMIILSDFPAGVFDELMVVFMDVFNTKSVFYTRLGVEMLAIALALVFGMLAGIGFGAVNLGSFVLAVILAPILSWQMRWMGAIIYDRS